MKVLKVMGLGMAIWGLSLFWPDINLLLTPRMMIGLGLGLGAAWLLYDLGHRLSRPHKGNGTGQDHLSHPLPPIALAQ